MLTPEIVVILFTQGLPYMQCTTVKLTENYIVLIIKFSRSIN